MSKELDDRIQRESAQIRALIGKRVTGERGLGTVLPFTKQDGLVAGLTRASVRVKWDDDTEPWRYAYIDKLREVQ